MSFMNKYGGWLLVIGMGALVALFVVVDMIRS